MLRSGMVGSHTARAHSRTLVVAFLFFLDVVFAERPTVNGTQLETASPAERPQHGKAEALSRAGGLEECVLQAEQGAQVMLEYLQKCVKRLIEFGDKTQEGMLASKNANKAYVTQFLAVLAELNKLRDSSKLAEAFAEDNNAAYKVLSGELDHVQGQIMGLVGE